MAQMNVSIPEKLKGWAEARVAEGRYSGTSDYIIRTVATRAT